MAKRRAIGPHTHIVMCMVIDMVTAYRQGSRQGKQRVRVVIEMPKEEVEAVDRWGVPAGMPSRNAALRRLLQEGLKTAPTSSQAESEPDAC